MTQRDAEADEPRESASPFSLLVALTAGLSAVVLLGALLVIERVRVTHEVLVWAPEHVQVGDAVPMRALVFTDLEGDAGGRLVQPAVHVRLLSGDVELAHGVLTPSAFESVAATLHCEACRGDIRLIAEVRDDDILLARTERLVHFVEEVPPLPEGMRIADALQLLQLESDARVQALLPELDVRTTGGVCVAEATCELLLQGVPRDVRLSECDNVSLQAQHLEGSLRTLQLVIHGPEAHCVVETEIETPRTEIPLENDGARPSPVTPLRFGLQLPVALATARLDTRGEETTLVMSAEPPIGRTEVIVDIYRQERWIETRVLEAGETVRVDVAAPDVYRLQARADVMSAERAYLRWVDTTQGETATQRWAFAARETELIGIPAPTSGLATDEAALAERRGWMRAVTALGVISAVLLMLAAVVRRGVASEAEARRLLVASGVEGADDEAARRRSGWTVLAYVSAIALAIWLGLAFLLARPFWVG